MDATTGKIGDVTVKWNITPSDDNAYQNNLDATLLKQESAAADDKIDLFLVEADYALKYVDTDYTMPIADLGITDADLANQYQYTKDIVTDSNGVLKGVSWQGIFSRIKNKTADWVNLRNLWILRDCVRENYNHGIGHPHACSRLCHISLEAYSNSV